mmetsp:Transcript_22147/g.62088  ORF Transcript_22147/g.62088 Transcript_22147/m.62088 type:complete len:496 (+) Transcript_22147:64-1551(+)
MPAKVRDADAAAEASEAKIEDVEKAQKPEARKTLCDLVMTIKEHVMADVAGPLYHKVCYYVVLALAALSFVLASVSVLASITEETITSASVTIRDKIRMPAIFGCVTKSDLYWISNGSVSPPPCAWGTVWHFSFKTEQAIPKHECFRWTSANNYQGFVSFAGVASDREREALTYLLDFYSSQNPATPHWACFLGNVDGGIVSTRDDPVQIVLDMEIHYNSSSASTEAIHSVLSLGLFDPTRKETIRSVMEGSVTFFYGTLINAINHLKIEYDEVVDLRGNARSFFGGEGAAEIEKGMVSGLYRASSASAEIVHNRGGPHPSKEATNLIFEVGSFVGQTITLRNKYLAELWMELGGAWAGAALIITCCFYEKVGGVKGTVQVFRFNSVKSKEELAACATRELGNVLRDHLATTLAQAGIETEAEEEKEEKAAKASQSPSATHCGKDQVKAIISELLQDREFRDEVRLVLQREDAPRLPEAASGERSVDLPGVLPTT